MRKMLEFHRYLLLAFTASAFPLWHTSFAQTTGETTNYLYWSQSGTNVAIIGCEAAGPVIVPTNINGGTVTRIGDYGFCTYRKHRPGSQVTSVSLPNTITTFGVATFGGCSYLTKGVFPTALSRMDAAVFYGCVSLNNIRIPRDLTIIGDGAFGACYNLSNICFSGSPPLDRAQTAFIGDSDLHVIHYMTDALGWTNGFESIPTSPSTECPCQTMSSRPPVISVSPLRVIRNISDMKIPASVNDPISPVADLQAMLENQVPLGLGAVADGVTPVLFIISGTPTNYSLQVSSAVAFFTNGDFNDRIFVLNGDQWNRTTNLTIVPDSSGTNGTTFAYLQGINWSDFDGINHVSNELTAILTLNCAGHQITNSQFEIRPVPVILVHGIKDTGATWSSGFLNAIRQNIPDDFIIPITYGVGTSEGFGDLTWPCTIGRFTDLAIDLDNTLHGIENLLSTNWDFTRYDVVGHSQGGVLLRMLCQTNIWTAKGQFTANKDTVVSPNNIWRGRFRRIVTIGAPHNGTTIAYYCKALYERDPSWSIAFNLLPGGLAMIQKFDPSGEQIACINNPAFPVDANIGFHCIKSTISDGNSDWQVYRILGLQNIISAGHEAGLTRGQVLIPYGADGIVDQISQGGGSGTPSSHDFFNVAHAAPEQLFGVGPGITETALASVGIEVANLLTGPDSNFGAFQLPSIISDTDKALYDGLLPVTHETAISQGGLDFWFWAGICFLIGRQFRR